jgi:hypothetical protein
VRDNMSSIRSSIHTFTHASISSSVNSFIPPQKHRLPIQPLFHPPINPLIYLSVSPAIGKSIDTFINSSKSSSLNHLPLLSYVHLSAQSLISSLINTLIFPRTHPSILSFFQHNICLDSNSTFPPSTHLVLNPTEPLIQLPHIDPFTHIQPHIFNNPSTSHLPIYSPDMSIIVNLIILSSPIQYSSQLPRELDDIL